jgi:hypothetical protein
VTSFASIADALDVLVEERPVEPDWETVLCLAGVEQYREHRRQPTEWFHQRPRLRLVAALAAVFVAILAATALATGLADRFSAWISGKPGAPAPSTLQQGFNERNRVSLAAFPAGTKLRLLLRERVSGTSFDLLGFRNGDAYCLRLVRSDRPGGRGSNQCLRADELSGRAALVADNVWFRVGNPEISITGIYGFASDDVKSVRVTRARDRSVVSVKNNVFLSLRGQRSGTVQHHPKRNPVEAVAALMRSGSVRNIPYVISGGGILPGGARPTVPSYFAPPNGRSIPGAPTTVAASIKHAAVGWIVRGEKRGSPLPVPKNPNFFPKLDFGRLIQPDPDDPLRIGVGIGPAHGMTRGHPVRGKWICLIEFDSLTVAGGSSGCGPFVGPGRPMALGSWFESPITHFNGVVSDGITRVAAFLADGRQVPAALRDNVFAVAVPQASLPGEIVGYDASGRVAAIVQLQANAVVKPCPPAEFPTPVSKLPPPEKWERIDLGSLTVGGEPILGKTPDEVQAILGTPALIRPRAQLTSGVNGVFEIPEFRYGGTTPSTLGLSIVFAKRDAKIVANTLYFQASSLVDARLGHLLRLQPTDLQRLLMRTYGSHYRLSSSYGTSPFLVGQLQCGGSFHAKIGSKAIDFGLNPNRPSRPYLAITASGP